MSRSRAPVHNGFIAFRLADRLVSAAEIKATERGMSLSEYLRDLVRRDALVD